MFMITLQHFQSQSALSLLLPIIICHKNSSDESGLGQKPAGSVPDCLEPDSLERVDWTGAYF